jgi:aspartyl/asparaginyl beta-hydroxylase (cupin superfamily)
MISLAGSLVEEDIRKNPDILRCRGRKEHMRLRKRMHLNRHRRDISDESYYALTLVATADIVVATK